MTEFASLSFTGDGADAAITFTAHGRTLVSVTIVTKLGNAEIEIVGDDIEMLRGFLDAAYSYRPGQ